MTGSISNKNFTNNIFSLFEETFETHHGNYLDKGTTLFETLDGITAEEASRPVSARCASIAAQVTHIIFYMEVLEKLILHQEGGKVDWGEIWSRVEAVTSDEWAALKLQLQQAYQHLSSMLHAIDDWDDEDRVGGTMAIVVHTAYHLGEIRQALCTLK